MSYERDRADKRKSAQDLVNSRYYEHMIKRPEKLDRRLEATEDFRFFCETYGAEAFSMAWSPAHLECLEKIQDATLTHGNFALALPRGMGKSTMCHYGMLWSLLCGHAEYAIYVAATIGASSQRLASLKSTLRFNQDLYEDFPEVIAPIRWCQGEARKAGGQRFADETTEIRWGSDKLIFATLQDFDEHASWYSEVPNNMGAIMDFASMESGLRGKSVEKPDGSVIRPQVAIVDDPQTRESAASPTQVKKRYDILAGDISYLGSPSRPCGVIVPTTIVYEDDLSCMLMDHEKMPQYRGEKHGALNHLPWENTDLPQQEEELIQLWENDYAELRRFDLLDGTNHATEMYRKNQKEMDANCVALWPERFNKDEISAVQNCMNLYLKDQEAFFAEFMNQPTPAQTGLKPKLKPADIEMRQVEIKRNIIPADCDTVVAFIDVSMKCLWWSVVAFNKQTYRAHVVNAGVYPEQGKPYVILSSVKRTIQDRYPHEEYSVALFNTLGDFVDEIVQVEYVSENGRPVDLEAIGIDAGWGQENDTVLKFCRRHTQKRMLHAFKGWGSTPLKKPLVDPEKQPDCPASLTGQWKYMQNRYGAKSLIFDTNLWKSRVDNALRVTPTSNSALTIYGGRENGRLPNIRMLTEQMSAEEGVLVEAQGRSIEQWKNDMNKDNHLFDCVVGCYALANVKGAEVQTDATVRKIRNTTHKKKRRRYKKG